MTPQCHVTISIKLSMIIYTYPVTNGVKFALENIEKIEFFRHLLGYVICPWSHFNAPHTNLTLIFLKSKYYTCIILRQLVIWSAVALRETLCSQ